MADKRYLFEYEFNGATYGQEVVARDHYQATLKLEAMAGAEYKGEIAARIPASPWSFWRRNHPGPPRWITRDQRPWRVRLLEWLRSFYKAGVPGGQDVE